MKILKRITAAICAAVMLASAMPLAGAEYTDAEKRNADVLYTLGLVLGSD